MLRIFLTYHVQLILIDIYILATSLFSPSWHHDKTPDKQHFHRRRYTEKYLKKQRIVRALWFSVGILSMALQAPYVVIPLFLLATFMSFSILDETE